MCINSSAISFALQAPLTVLLDIACFTMNRQHDSCRFRRVSGLKRRLQNDKCKQRSTIGPVPTCSVSVYRPILWRTFACMHPCVWCDL